MLFANFEWEVHMPLDFDLNNEQQMLRKMVRNSAEKEMAPVAQRTRIVVEPEFDFEG